MSPEFVEDLDRYVSEGVLFEVRPGVWFIAFEKRTPKSESDFVMYQSYKGMTIHVVSTNNAYDIDIKCRLINEFKFDGVR